MEERQNNFPKIFFSVLISALKELKINFKQEYNPSDKKFYSWPEFSPGMWGKGITKEASITDMLEVMKESAQSFLQEAPEKIEQGRRAYIAKIIISTPEELKSCLVGPICEDF